MSGFCKTDQGRILSRDAVFLFYKAVTKKKNPSGILL